MKPVLIELHYDGKPFVVNANFIVSIERCKTGSYIRMVGGDAVADESMEDITKLIARGFTWQVNRV